MHWTCALERILLVAYQGPFLIDLCALPGDKGRGHREGRFLAALDSAGFLSALASCGIFDKGKGKRRWSDVPLFLATVTWPWFATGARSLFSTQR